MILEACVNSAFSAAEAERGGASRVELCENMAVGGTTPSMGTIREARRLLSIDLYVMIRPRGSDFGYSTEEFRIMQDDVRVAKESGANGVVFGILNDDGTIDRERMKLLIDLARPMGITFHRAFDFVPDPFHAMEELIELNVDRILTSGQEVNAIAGASLIRKLIQQSNGRIIIMPGGGVKEYNIREAIELTGAEEYHLYLTKNDSSKGKYPARNVKLSSQPDPENGIVIVDAEKIRQVKEIIREKR
jgi:copper homeostasis protein